MRGIFDIIILIGVFLVIALSFLAYMISQSTVIGGGFLLGSLFLGVLLNDAAKF